MPPVLAPAPTPTAAPATPPINLTPAAPANEPSMDADTLIDNLEGEGGDASPPPSGDIATTPPQDAPGDKTSTSTSPEPAKPAGEAKPPSGDDLEGLVTKKVEPAKPAAQEPEPKTPKELRERYNATKAEREKIAQERDAAAKERDALRAELQAAKSAQSASVDPAKFQSQIDQLTKDLTEARETVRFLDYTKSQEYQEQFIKPIAKEWERIEQDLVGVQIGEEGNKRPATMDDVMQIVSLTGPAARATATAVFGDAASDVLAYRMKLRELYAARDQAKTEWQGKADAWQKQRTEAATAQAASAKEAALKLYSLTQESLTQSYPELFKVPEAAESKAQYDSGSALVDKAFMGKGVDGKPLSGEEIVKAQASVALRAKFYGVERKARIAAEAKIAELEAKLKDFEKSEPAPGGGKPAKPAAEIKPEDESFGSAIDKIPGFEG